MKARLFICFLTSSIVGIGGCYQPKDDLWKSYQSGGAYSDIPAVAANSKFAILSVPGENKGDLYRYSFAGRKMSRLTDSGQFDLNAILTKNEQFVFFERANDGLSHIYCIKSDGTGERQVTSGRVVDEVLSSTDDGGMIIIARSPSNQPGMEREARLYLVDTRNQANAPVECGTSAMFSADFRTVFTVPVDDPGHLYTSDFSMSQRKVVTAATRCCAVSQNGEQIAFLRGKTAWTRNLMSGTESAVGEGFIAGFVESGTKTLVVPFAPGPALFTYDSDTNVRNHFQVTENAGCGFPRISSDGIYFAVRLNNHPKSRAGSVCVVNMETGRFVKVWPDRPQQQ